MQGGLVMKQKNSKTRLFCLLLAVGLAAASVGGCTTSQTGGETSGSGSSASEESAAFESEIGLTEPLTITWMREENSTIPLSNDVLAIQEIEKRLGVTIDLQPVPESDYSTKASTLLATNNLPDVMNIDDTLLKQYHATGMFVNIRDYVDSAPDYLGLMDSDERKSDTVTFEYEGGLYGFRALEKNRIAIAILPVIRMDLLEKNNIPIPTTWDELYQVLLKLKELNPDQYVFAGRNGTNCLVGNFAYVMGSGGFGNADQIHGIYLEPETDKWVYGPTDPNFKSAVEFLHNAYADGLLHPDYAIMTRDMCFEKLTSGELTFFFDNTTFCREFNVALKEIDPDAKFDLLAPMENSLGQTRAERFNRDWNEFTVVSSQVERPADIVSFFNWLYTEDGSTLTNYGVEGQTYEIADGQPKLLDSVLEIGDYAQIRAEYGLGNYCVAKYIDEGGNINLMNYQGEQSGEMPINIEQAERIDQFTEDGIIRYAPLFPSFTEEELQQVTDLETKLSATFDQEIDKFITGARDMSEYDSLIEDLKAIGSEELEKLYNDAYSRALES